jgi:3'-phosphoadenosine 5'-phosphosulfate sulfotransferase (PAPS reductase)/FAD synthetase
VTRRRRHIQPRLPGIGDHVEKQPPKAGEAPKARTLDEAIARAHDLIGQALDRYPIVARQALFSGGDDSSLLLHLVQDYLDSSASDAVVHVHTGIGIEETRDHVRDITRGWNLPLRELHPRDNYDDLVMGGIIARTGKNAGKRPVWKGFPGPGGKSHRVMYRRLKDEPLQRNRAAIIGSRGRQEKVLYLAGMRWDESEPRFRNASELDPRGGIIWVSPIVHFTNAQMLEYRERFLVPRNPVAIHTHGSGECKCGAFAKENELEEIEFWYPQTAYRIRALEKKAADAGIRACRWGKRPPGSKPDLSDPYAGPLCGKCVPQRADQPDLMTTWQEMGLLKPAIPSATAPGSPLADDKAGH